MGSWGGAQELNNLYVQAIWASLYHETSSLSIHVEKMASCVLMCCASMCRTGDAQIYMLELAWRRFGNQCSVHLCRRLFCLCIDACVSLYHTRHASCDMFKLAGNRLAKKRNYCAGLCRSTKRTSLSYASDSCPCHDASPYNKLA